MQSPRHADAHGMMCGRCLHLSSSMSCHTEETRQRRRKKRLRNGKEHIDMALIDLTELHKVLQDFARDVQERYKDVLTRNDHVASKRLRDSINTRVEVNEQSFEVIMNLEEYWKYVENDTKPHFPPPSALIKWIEVKPVIPRPMANGKLPTTKQLAYLIGRKIADEGTKGTHDLEETKDDIIKWYRDRISAALGQDMSNYIRKVMFSGN